MTSIPAGVILHTRRQSDKSAAAHIEFCSVLASLGVYTEFGIEPQFLREATHFAKGQTAQANPAREYLYSASIPLH